MKRSEDHDPNYDDFATEAEDRIYRAYNLLVEDTAVGTGNARSIAQEWYLLPEQYAIAWQALLLTAAEELEGKDDNKPTEPDKKR